MKSTPAIAALLMAGAALAACQKDAKAPSGPLVVGFSQIGSESGWRTAETKLAQSAAKERNIDLKVSDAQQQQENQIKAIRSFVAQGVGAIFLAPVVSTGWDNVLGEARDAKIPVILIDRQIETKDPTLFLTA